jgi:hypothetical protein
LLSGEFLDLAGATGLIVQLRSDAEKPSCEFNGMVKELATHGPGEREQNLTPTWLDWLRQRDALVQFWALAVYLAGLGLTVGRWWRGAK